MSRRLALVLATWFGCGYSPLAPGTAGSAAAILIAIALHQFAGFHRWHFLWMAVVLFPPATWAAGAAARARNQEDPPIVVVDEVIGQWLTLCFAHAFNWKTWLYAFLLFRLFDIVKPWPVRRLEGLPGGLGINADDVMAGAYAGAALLVAGSLGMY